MQRIPAIQQNMADPETGKLLDAVSKKMGMVPNLVATLANSLPAANAYLGFSQALSSGALSARLREKISLVVGEANQCDYCVSAHSMIGKKLGMSESETLDARQAQAHDDKERAALEFSQAIVEQRGMVSDEDLGRVRAAGFADREIVEIVANVALNIFTNYFNHVAETIVDFPKAPSLTTA